MANPILSSLDVKRILFQRITNKGDDLKKAFHLLDTGNDRTVSKNELRRVIADFLLPLTREQFQDILAQVRCREDLESPTAEEMLEMSGACNLA